MTSATHAPAPRRRCAPTRPNPLNPDADQRSRCALVLEGLPDAAVAAGRDGRIVFVNALAETLFGYGHDELIGSRSRCCGPERPCRYRRNMELYFGAEHPLRFPTAPTACARTAPSSSAR